MPAKVRLNAWTRDNLKAVAKKAVSPATERAALAVAYKSAAPLVRKMVEAKFPAKDMRVCAKYDVAEVDDCINMQFPNGVVDTFYFDEGTGPLVARATYHGQMYLADADTATAVEVWLDRKKAFEAERKKRLAVYVSLIETTTYAEDLVSVWPEAAEHIPAHHLPVALGPDEMALLAADRQERKAA